MQAATTEPIPDLICALAALRRAARAVTQLYADELQGLVDGPQFGLLMLLDRRPGSNQSTIGRIMVLDKTTLSRNLGLLKRNGWIQPVESEDRRERGFRLTRSGQRLLSRAKPAWERAQSTLKKAMGEDEWDQMLGVANAVTRTAHHITATQVQTGKS